MTASSGGSQGSIPPPGRTQTGTSRLWIKRTEERSEEKTMPATLSGKVMRYILIASLFFLAVFSSCYRDHLYVQQEWVDRNFLASTRMGTPDPRQANPPEGKRLLIAWDFPRSLFEKQLHLVITVRLWDETQETIQLPMERKRDSAAFFFPNKGMERSILTYRVQVFSKEGELIETWNHHFWTELIDISIADCPAAQESKDSVSSHPKQESVIETP